MSISHISPQRFSAKSFGDVDDGQFASTSAGVTSRGAKTMTGVMCAPCATIGTVGTPLREEYLRTTGSCERVRGRWSGRIVEVLENSGGGPLTQVRLVTRIIITSRATVTILGMMSTLTYRSASWMPRSTRLSAVVVVGLEMYSAP